MEIITITPIGTVRSSRKVARDHNWDDEKAFIDSIRHSFPRKHSPVSEISHTLKLFSIWIRCNAASWRELPGIREVILSGRRLEFSRNEARIGRIKSVQQTAKL